MACLGMRLSCMLLTSWRHGELLLLLLLLLLALLLLALGVKVVVLCCIFCCWLVCVVPDLCPLRVSQNTLHTDGLLRLVVQAWQWIWHQSVEPARLTVWEARSGRRRRFPQLQRYFWLTASSCLSYHLVLPAGAGTTTKSTRPGSLARRTPSQCRRQTGVQRCGGGRAVSGCGGSWACGCAFLGGPLLSLTWLRGWRLASPAPSSLACQPASQTCSAAAPVPVQV
jgi:hypothetical protein